MKFIVDRAKLNNSPGNILLYNSFSGKKSVLGFLAKCYGISNNALNGSILPSTVPNLHGAIWWPDTIVKQYYTTHIHYVLMNIKDSKISKFEKENEITNLFSTINIEVLFEN